MEQNKRGAISKRLIFFPHRVHRASLRAHCGSHILRSVVLNHDGPKGRPKGLKGSCIKSPRRQKDEKITEKLSQQALVPWLRNGSFFLNDPFI